MRGADMKSTLAQRLPHQLLRNISQLFPPVLEMASADSDADGKYPKTLKKIKAENNYHPDDG